MSLFLHDFHWLRPLWLLALVPTILLLILLFRTHFRRVQWHQHISPALLPALLDGPVSQANRWLLAGIGLFWVIASLVLAGPVWEKQPVPVVKNRQALVIAWDLSPSMLAKDISPSRLGRSRLKIIDLLNSREEGQTALVAYSAEAYTVTPLTDDIQTIINLLPALSPTTLPSVGSNPEMAFQQANDLLDQAGIQAGQIVMLTDEITPDALENLTQQVEDSPHQLTLWGVGDTEGAPIPLPQGGFVKDGAGNMVIVKLNERALQDFATQTNSYYVPMVTNGSDISTLQQLLGLKPDGDDSQTTDETLDQWIEHGHWLLWLCLPFVALSFRRGWLMCALVICGLPIAQLTPQAAYANPFKTPDQQGYDAFEQQAYDKAAEKFENSAWKGAALYRNGQYAEAAKTFANDTTASGDFNRGNAELLAGDVDAAISAFERALDKQPKWQAAEKNLALAKGLKQKQEQEKQQEQQSQDNEQQDDSQSSSSQDNSEQDSEQQSEQQSGEQSENQESNEDQASDSQEQEASQNQDSDGQSSSEASGEQGAEGQSSSAEEDTAQSAAQSDEESSQDSVSSEGMLMQQSENQEPQTEEEQRLEQALRKVSDDPAGLLRNKFKYQYRQRQQEIRQGTYGQSERAEQRW